MINLTKTKNTAQRGWILPVLLCVVVAAAAIAANFNRAAALQCLPDPCLNGLAPYPSGSDDYSPNDYAPECSPIIIDVAGTGFQLTSAEEGVQFDIRGTGVPVEIAWTAPGAANAFLALDRDNNGVISSGKELFGNFSQQPPSPHPNGFLALAELDKPENGGNGDGIIDQRDKIFADLWLWIDVNHDGISEAGELYKPQDLGVFSISVDYKESWRTDQYGNRFRYRAKININHEHEDASNPGRIAYDVFLAGTMIH